MRSATKVAALVLVAVATVAAPAQARFRAGFGLTGGHADNSDCAVGLKGAYGRVGLGLGPFLLDLQQTPSLLDLGAPRHGLLNPTSVLTGLRLFRRVEIGVGPTVGDFLDPHGERAIIGLHTRLAFHSARRKGWVLSFETMPVLGRDTSFTSVYMGLGWGLN